ncbi:pyridoxamine 5'-phosphate oxidase family protein [Sphingorhabdus sp. EL138]|uniref:pyridoxamine 5'-phosphate oxidase family protein n=1 Tax=Sphingorhabdus sp. EL138 TaxID=2073156 RepID=UPI0013A55B74|nr:pyridoxamine 5'-phosphate oxidase family protein [Sphingorhabdus sp. EL138]
MAKLSNEMRVFVANQRLGFLATVCADGSPNLSPKGLTFIYDDQRIVIGEVRSPGTIENLHTQPIAELNVVDRNTRKGFRFKGKCEVHSSGEDYEHFLAFLRKQGAQSKIRSVIVMAVDVVSPLLSPVYDDGASDIEVRLQWKRYYDGSESDHPAK